MQALLPPEALLSAGCEAVPARAGDELIAAGPDLAANCC